MILLAASCGKKDVHLEEDLSPRFEKAMGYFDKGKYSRAKDEFDYIIMADSGSKIANESQYYMLNLCFRLKNMMKHPLHLIAMFDFLRIIRKLKKHAIEFVNVQSICPIPTNVSSHKLIGHWNRFKCL